jgi:hypothetical protein
MTDDLQDLRAQLSGLGFNKAQESFFASFLKAHEKLLSAHEKLLSIVSGKSVTCDSMWSLTDLWVCWLGR